MNNFSDPFSKHRVEGIQCRAADCGRERGRVHDKMGLNTSRLRQWRRRIRPTLHNPSNNKVYNVRSSSLLSCLILFSPPYVQPAFPAKGAESESGCQCTQQAMETRCDFLLIAGTAHNLPLPPGHQAICMSKVLPYCWVFTWLWRRNFKAIPLFLPRAWNQDVSNVVHLHSLFSGENEKLWDYLVKQLLIETVFSVFLVFELKTTRSPAAFSSNTKTSMTWMTPQTTLWLYSLTCT